MILDAALFAAFHIPILVVHGEPPLNLLGVLGFGALFAILRASTGGLGLPVAVHVAIDLSS